MPTPSAPRARSARLAAVLFSVGTALALAAGSAHAQEAEQPALVATVEPSPQGTLRSGILLPAERTSGLKAHWAQRRDYLRDRDERRADDEEGRLRQLRDDLAIENVFSLGQAMVREGQQAMSAGLPGLARKRCQLAADLAPALPAAHACLARALLSEQPTALSGVAAHLGNYLRASWSDPRTRRSGLANLGGIILVGLLAAGALLVILFFFRYARLYMHDVHHVFPKGARSWQTAALAVALVLLPLLLQMGPIPLVFTAALACSLYLTSVELAATAVVLALFAVAPHAAEQLGRLAAFGGPGADVWLVEKGEGSPAALDRLQKRMQVARPEASIAFTLAHRAKREGDLDTAEKLYKKTLELGAGPSLLAATHNNIGNVYLLLGDTAKAAQSYTRAVELQETLAAPHFNLARAHGLSGIESIDRVQGEQARALELDRAGVEAFTGTSLQINKRSNKVAMDLPLPDSSLDQLLDGEARAAEPVADDVRALVAGPAPVAFGEATPLIVAALCIGLHFARLRLRPSGRCDRCGREVCKRCDADARPNEALCAQCVNVFVRKGNVDATERIKKELAVTRYQARRKVWSRALGVVSGASHVLLGYPVQGAIFLMLTGLLVASLVMSSGLAHEPFAIRPGVSILRVALTILGFVVVYALCLRNLSAHQRAEGL